MERIEEKKKNSKKDILLILLLLFMIFILSIVTVTYTFNSKIIDIVGFTGVYRETSWKVDFDNISLDREGSIYVEDISASNTSIKDFDITFIRPGDAFTIRLDVVNNGTLDAKLETFKISNIVCTYNNGSSADDYCDKYISYSIKYKDGSSIKKDDVLEAGETKTVVFKMSYADNAPVLYDEVISIDDMNMSFVYVQK
jgi:hypothetical protein